MSTLESLFASPWPWLILGLVVAGLEIVVPGVFMLWIGLGALLVGLSVLVAPELPIAWQLLIFAAAMLGSTSAGFFIQRRSKAASDAPLLNHPLDSLINRQFEAIEDFHNGRGRVRVGDSSYPASATGPIVSGDTVRVIAASNGVLEVEPASAAVRPKTT